MSDHRPENEDNLTVEPRLLSFWRMTVYSVKDYRDFYQVISLGLRLRLVDAEALRHWHVESGFEGYVYDEIRHLFTRLNPIYDFDFELTQYEIGLFEVY